MKLVYFDVKNFVCGCGCGGMPKEELMQAVDKLRMAFGSPLVVTSGYRCEAYNAKIGGAKKSWHMSGFACDLAPTKKPISELHAFAVKEAAALGLWIEDPAFTKTWLHIQIQPYASWTEGKSRVFKP